MTADFTNGLWMVFLSTEFTNSGQFATGAANDKAVGRLAAFEPVIVGEAHQRFI